MRDLSPEVKPFRSYSQHGAILELLNPAYDLRKPNRVIPRKVLTKPILLPHTPLHVRVRRAIAKELESQDLAKAQEAASQTEKVQPLGRVIHTPRKEVPPPIGTYNPNFDYLFPRSASVVVAKSAKLPMVGEIYAVPGNQSPTLCSSPNHRSPKVLPPLRQPGLSWTLQSQRGQLFDTSQGASESRFAAAPRSTFKGISGGNFQKYQARGDLFPVKPDLPDYEPNYSSVSSYPIKPDRTGETAYR